MKKEQQTITSHPVFFGSYSLVWLLSISDRKNDHDDDEINEDDDDDNNLRKR